MKIFEKYLLQQFIKNTLIVIFVFITIFSIFNLLNEFKDIGIHNYTFASAIAFIIFNIPQVLSEVFNFGILIGGLLTIGLLLEKRELVVIQNGIVSPRDIALRVVKYGFIVSSIFLIIAEISSPSFTQYSESYKASKTGKNYEVFKGGNIWLKKSSKFIYIDKNNNKKDLQDILVFDFTNEDQLTLSKSSNGKIINSNLEQVDATVYKFVKKNKLYDSSKKNNHNVLTELGVEPDFLTPETKRMDLYTLAKQIARNEQLGLNSDEYQIELLSRITKPIYAIILLMIAIPLVYDFSRNQNLSKNVFLGILIGLIFNLIMKFTNVMAIKVSYETILVYLILIIFLYILAVIFFNKRFTKI